MKALGEFIAICVRRGGGDIGPFQNLVVMPNGKAIAVFALGVSTFSGPEEMQALIDEDRQPRSPGQTHQPHGSGQVPSTVPELPSGVGK